MRPNSSHLIALAAAGACAAAAAWLALSEHPLVDPGAPRTSAAPVQRLEASVPDIAAFESYNINAENPFIPFNLRKSEREGLTKKPTSTAPRPPPEVVKPERPPLPRLAAAQEQAPRALGLITLPGGRMQVAVAGAQGQALVAVGQTVDGWTLAAVEHGAVVVWRDAQGGTVSAVIGGSAGDDAPVVFGNPARAATAAAGKPASAAATKAKPLPPQAGPANPPAGGQAPRRPVPPPR